MTSSHPNHDTDALQARLASRLSAALGERTATLPHDIGERLRVAREQAVARAREQGRAPTGAATAPVLLGRLRGGAALLGGPARWWQRLATVLPLVVLLSGLLVIDRWADQELVLAAADIDAGLLADDLPPAAYADPGFAEFLKMPLP